jgi:hypothetical protein
MKRCGLPAVWEGPAGDAAIGAMTFLGVDPPVGVRRGESYSREAETTFRVLI